MNRIFLIGRLTKDPDMKIIEDTGKIITRFTLAVEREYRNANGERDVDFFPIVVWGKRAEAASEYLTKGSLISVCGRLANRSYEDEHGVRRYVSEVIADSFQFLDLKKAEENVG
ncbi:single-stranded DNA-binding protein [Clostridium thermarum]|uniref:single-stranded DNA-binding protein n=1 Tax=Clostridium thermarum TaxID=1716543 RepID=UPI0013D0B440|nr:single-stranded DNA-binding protein [Clostridium thermarum]